MIIREILFEDLIQISNEYIEYFNNYEDSDWCKIKVTRKFKQLVQKYDFVGLGLYCEEKIIGFAIGVLSQFDDGMIAILNELFIIKSMQSKGYGTKLLIEFENVMKSKGAFRIQLESANDDIHNNFYNKINGYLDAKNNVLKAKSL